MEYLKKSILLKFYLTKWLPFHTTSGSYHKECVSCDWHTKDFPIKSFYKKILYLYCQLIKSVIIMLLYLFLEKSFAYFIYPSIPVATDDSESDTHSMICKKIK